VNRVAFHVSRYHRPKGVRPRTQRVYAGEGDKVFAFVVTSDGEVYKQNQSFGFGAKEYFFEFDAKSGSEGSIWNVDVKGDLSALKPSMPGYKEIRAALAEKKDATIRVEWFKNGLRYVDDLWSRTQKVQNTLKPSAQTVAAAQAAAAGAAVTGVQNAA